MKYCSFDSGNPQISYFFSQLDSDEDFSQLSSGIPDDYQLALKHEVGDFDPIPMSLQKEIRDFAEIKFWPAVLEYLGNIFPKYRAYSICQVELRGLNLWNYKGRITGEMAYDLHNVEHILSMLPTIGYAKIGGKRDIGSVIRICKAINKQNLADNIYQIVEKCFTPYNHQDPKDSSRFNFGLYVEPSTGGIQCDCCKGK